MLGIDTETMIFFYAMLSGMIIFFSYQLLNLFRIWVEHHFIVVNLEDFLFWVAVSVYLFRQMYVTTYGSVRWFFILGVVLGMVVANFVLSSGKKFRRKVKKTLENKGRKG
jgi:uncharacterized membrane protein